MMAAIREARTVAMCTDIAVLSDGDRTDIAGVINAAATRYEGVIPEEADTDPYMPMEELEREMAEIQFYGIRRDRLVGVIGLQERGDASLIRHLYVHPEVQREGIGTKLLETGIKRADSRTVLVGTWKAAEWAVRFYEQYGFENLGTDIDRLRTYWDIPNDQTEASVVLRYQEPI